MFKPIPTSVHFPDIEGEIGRFWKERQIYEKSLEKRAGAESFVFYEGPPTANGMPHPGHCLTRAIKDLFPRYRTMRGYRCERKAGWDTHGLPVEVEVCKELGIHSKDQIEDYGIEPFIHKCQESVWRYMKEWERLTERIGFWIHLDEAYVTYHQCYVESVWWSLKNLFERGLLYQGHKIVWWWAQGGTALSSGEVGQGYREVADPSVYVRFPLLDDRGQTTDTALLVWTTTPWTLPGNQFVAVHPDLAYATVLDNESGEKLILAEALVEGITAKVQRELRVVETHRGSELVGQRYRPPFDHYYNTDGQTTAPLKAGGTDHTAWRVVPASFVTLDSGTGVVHQAPAFGEVDYDVLITQQDRFADDQGPRLICPVAPNGNFTAEAPDYQGRWVKEADKDITRQLHQIGLLYHREQYVHEYPFCWRAEEDPLIQYPRKSWFIRTTQFKDRMLENNAAIHWLPDHIRDGRMGNFLATNVDWALSRERFWGTPLPIWVCDQTGRMEAMESYAELLEKPQVQGTEVWESAKKKKPSLPDDLRVHKPYIDAITYASPFAPAGRMQRVPEVIDCWYDSGAMPFAQWGYPHQGRDAFDPQFPADFISEALDQTRGWFYSLLAISTLLFAEPDPPDSDPDNASKRDFPHPYANCIVLGLMLAEWWESKDGKQLFLSEQEAKAGGATGGYVHRVGKMSKQKRNYREPQDIFDRYGADPLRWYFFANQAPWTSIRYSEQAIRDSIPEFLLRLWNVYSFFVIYANIDQFDPADLLGNIATPAGGAELDSAELATADRYRPADQRSELDRWALGELNRTVHDVIQHMDAYENFPACQRLSSFVDALSNWYVRRSRDRFWSSDKQSQDKLDAYWTLYECLLTTTKLVAPFVPFVAESLWSNLAGIFGDKALESVHLCDYPTTDASVVDETLSERMKLLREIASLGRAARMDAKLKVRQPLAQVDVILADPAHQSWLEEHDGLLREELNVRAVRYSQQAQQFITYHVQPNFKRLGPRLGRQLPALKQTLAQADGGQLLTELNAQGQVQLSIEGQTVSLDRDDIQVRLQAKPGWAAAQGPSCVVVLSTELTPALIRAGYARDLVRLIQDRRKELGCQYTDRIEVGLVVTSDEWKLAIVENADDIQQETLCVKLALEPFDGIEPVEVKVADENVQLHIRVVPSPD